MVQTNNVNSSKSVPASTTPQVDGFKVIAKLTGNFSEVASALRSISFLQVAPEKSSVNVAYIESRDINKNPYLFSIVKFRESEIEVSYSIPSEIGPRKRKLDMLSHFLNLLTLVEKNYSIDNRSILQLVESTVKEISGSVTMEYNKLFTSYDSAKKDLEDYKLKIENLTEQNQLLSSQNYELRSVNDELTLRVNQLESLPEDSLKSKLQQWVLEHNGTINVSEFSRIYKVPETRVEEVLNKLLSEGYLALLD
jgi:hypothetical protein